MANRLMQPSFAGGEISPRLHARVDLTKYKTGAKLLKNFILHPHGGVSKRPGLRFVGEAKNFNGTRLIPFIASSDDAYVIEMGDAYLRFFRNGGRVLATDGIATYEIVTPWTTAFTGDVKYAQSNDILTMVHGEFAPRELARYDHNNWTLTTITFQPGIATPGVPTVAATNNYTGTDYVDQVYYYAVTAVNKDGDESLISASKGNNSDLRFWPKNRMDITIAEVPGAVRYNVYRYSSGLWGYIGTAKPSTVGTTTAIKFEDKNFLPDLADGPPEGTNPFGTAGNYPRATSFFQQRRLFASTVAKPQTVWGTQTANYYNMTAAVPAKANDAFEFSLASRSIQKVHHLVALGDLLILTKSTEWKMTGGEGELVTPTSVSMRPQSQYGAAKTPEPLMIGDQVLFVEDKGWRVRDIGYRYDVDKYTGSDLTILADHLFSGRTIKGWAYQNIPYSAIWCVMSDGRLLALTYLREHEVWGWTQHETDGIFVDVAVIPEGEQDTPYFLVDRKINGTWRRFVERMAIDEQNDQYSSFLVDCGLTLDTPLKVNTFAITGGTLVATLSVATGHNLAVGDYVLLEHLSRNTRIRTEAHLRVRAVSSGTITLENEDGSNYADTVWLTWSDGSQTGAYAYLREKFQTVTGLSHLDGMSVVGLADGRVVGFDTTLTVSGGSVTLPFRAARIHLGLPYTADLESLELVAADKVVIGYPKNLEQIRVRVSGTSGIEVGPAFDLLQANRTLTQLAAYPPPAPITGDIKVDPEGRWTEHGNVCVRARYPLPASILGLVPDIEYGQI